MTQPNPQTDEDAFDLSAINALVAEEPPVVDDEPEEEELLEGEEPGEIDELEEELEEEVQVTPEKKKRNANTRIKDLTDTIKEKDRRLEELEKKFNNMQQGIDFLKPKEEVSVVSLDDKLQKAAVLAGEKDFDIDEFSTDAEKKAALLGYENKITLKQQEDNRSMDSVRNQYAQTVEVYKAQDPAIGEQLVAFYNAAVRNEAIAIMRRYPNLSAADAAKHAERALLSEAREAQDPVVHIAAFGKQILDDAQSFMGKVLTKGKEKGTIDHKNRDAVRARSGKPEIDTAPTTKRGQQIESAYNELVAEW